MERLVCNIIYNIVLHYMAEALRRLACKCKTLQALEKGNIDKVVIGPAMVRGRCGVRMHMCVLSYTLSMYFLSDQYPHCNIGMGSIWLVADVRLLIMLESSYCSETLEWVVLSVMTSSLLDVSTEYFSSLQLKWCICWASCSAGAAL